MSMIKLALCTLCAVSLVCCVEQQEAQVDTTQQSITAGTNPVFQELRSIGGGKFPEVMNTPGCTGTILGPHAVLTARHCGFTGTIQWPDSGLSYAIQSSLANPYADLPAFYPAWWQALNQEQINLGIRLDDWPAQHDNRILFVPSLTEDLLASMLNQYDVVPQIIDPYASSNIRYFVGMSNPAWREYAKINGFEPLTSNPPVNGIACHNVNPTGQCVRDGYFRVDDSVSSDLGDSGGPVLGAMEYQRNGRTVTGPRHVIGTMQNVPVFDVGPISHDSNQTLSVNQKRTVRLNQLWIKAAISDADQDNLPFECDNDPSSASNPINQCIAAAGQGFGKMDDPTEPKALLQCKDGYAVTGLKGRQGWLIDRLAVRCTPLSCLEQSSASCSNGHAYWTDHFGGETNGGTSFEKTCDLGKVLTNIGARHLAGNTLNEIRPYCRDYNAHVLAKTSTTTQALGTIGNSAGARHDGVNVPWQDCPAYGFIKGFEVRSKTTGMNNMNFITGLQPVCSGEIQHATYAGAFGGTVHDLKCPKNHVVVGVSAQPNYNNHLGVFALLCLNEDDISFGQQPHDQQLIAVYGSAFDAQGFYPAHQKSFLSFKLDHQNLTTRKCAPGKTLRGATFRKDTLLNQLKSIQCEDSRPNVYGSVDYALNIGSSQGSVVGSYCGVNHDVTGMLIHSGWAVDGLSFYCKPQ